MDIKVVPLGAGQDVGRSCVIVTLNGRNVMFDCGMHMGFQDKRRFPDFKFLSNGGDCTEVLDAVVITHFHLDHCGALPYFTEVIGFDGPIFMTKPTKAIAPILLEDFRKITVARKGEMADDMFTTEDIKNCMKKVITVNLHETFKVDDDFEVKPYYAGHVLGAAMFYVKAGGQSVVYTGDYNMTPDRHLGAAWIDRCRPDLLISESTYATTVRDSKRARERDFLKKVFDAVSNGGKVLIPVFALGRAQELCILLETFWQRMDLKVPIYFSAGLTEKANDYYKMFINWTNQKIKQTFVERNMFEFTHISAFDNSYADNPGPQVLFATPGMLHGGTSLEVFCKWAPDPKNMIIMPGYCVAGTTGWKVLQGHKEITVEGRIIPIKLSVQHLSFSAHADAKGIMQLLQQAQPKNVMLVHGEKKKMAFLKDKIVAQFGVPCYFPQNGETVTITSVPPIPIGLEVSLVKRQLEMSELTSSQPASDRAITRNGNAPNNTQQNNGFNYSINSSNKSKSINRINISAQLGLNGVGERGGVIEDNPKPMTRIRVDGVLVMAKDKPLRLMDAERAMRELGVPSHELGFECRWPLRDHSANAQKSITDTQEQAENRPPHMGTSPERHVKREHADTPLGVAMDTDPDTDQPGHISGEQVDTTDSTYDRIGALGLRDGSQVGGLQEAGVAVGDGLSTASSVLPNTANGTVTESEGRGVIGEAMRVLRQTLPVGLHSRLRLINDTIHYESMTLSLDESINQLVVCWAYKDDTVVEHLLPQVRQSLAQYIVVQS